MGGAALGPLLAGLGQGGYQGDHQGERLRCEHCNREMKNEHSLNVHISRYHNQAHQPTQAVCPVCNKTYSNQYSLRTHMHLQARAPHIVTRATRVINPFHQLPIIQTLSL